MQAEPDPVAKLATFAGAVVAIQPRMAPLFQVLQQAATTEPALAALWTEIAQRRAANMRWLADAWRRLLLEDPDQGDR